jgi:hypothetical protein
MLKTGDRIRSRSGNRSVSVAVAEDEDLFGHKEETWLRAAGIGQNAWLGESLFMWPLGRLRGDPRITLRSRFAKYDEDYRYVVFTVVPLPPGENPFAVKINNNNLQLGRDHLQWDFGFNSVKALLYVVTAYFKVKNLCSLPTAYIYVFHTILRLKSYYFRSTVNRLDVVMKTVFSVA